MLGGRGGRFVVGDDVSIVFLTCLRNLDRLLLEPIDALKMKRKL